MNSSPTRWELPVESGNNRKYRDIGRRSNTVRKRTRDRKFRKSGTQGILINERIDRGGQNVKKMHKMDAELRIAENMRRRGHQTHDGPQELRVK